MTRQSLRSLLLRVAHKLEQGKPLPQPVRNALARELKAAAEKGIRS